MQASAPNLTEAMDVLADIARADICLLQLAGDQFIVTNWQPPTGIPSIFNQPRVGTQFPAYREPAALRALQRARVIHGPRGVMVRNTPVTQIAAPLVGSAEISISAERSQLLPSGTLPPRRFLQQLASALAIRLDGSIPEPYLLALLRGAFGVVITDPSGIIAYRDSHARDIFDRLGHSGRLRGARVDVAKLPGAVVLRHEQGEYCETIEVQCSGVVAHLRTIPLHATDDGVSLRILTDVTRLRRSERELMVKSAVIQEIHHRVKNNLQTVASLLRLQQRREDDARVKRALNESINRILGIAAVHELLSHDGTEAVNLTAMLRQVVDTVLQTLAPHGVTKADVTGDTVYLPAPLAVPLALVVNELVQNALEHGAAKAASPQVSLQVQQTGAILAIEVRDSGPGFPDGLDPNHTGSLGLQIAHTLIVDDLHGRLTWHNDGGAVVRVELPRNAPRGG